MASKPEALRERTKRFALRILRLFKALPKTDEARIIGRQLLRAGASVAANYRSCHRARSRAEFAAKMGLVLEEADEALFWLELLGDGGIIEKELLSALASEAQELVRIFSASTLSARRAAMSAPRTADKRPPAGLS